MLCKVTSLSLLSLQTPPPHPTPARPAERQGPWLTGLEASPGGSAIPGTDLQERRTEGGQGTLLGFIPVTCPLSCRVGHGMDSRPAMAIFELLDYIVNEVCALGLRALWLGN